MLSGGVGGAWDQDRDVLSAPTRREANSMAQGKHKGKAIVVVPARSFQPVQQETVAEPKVRTVDFDPFAEG